jgi:hypothetical protein
MLSTRQLSLIETTRFGVPLGGKWYRGEADVVMEHAKKKGYLLSWDVPNRGRIHGIYQDLSLEEFSRTLNKVPPEHRYGYQLLLSTEECPGYMILQWRGDADPTHSVLREALARLTARCSRVLPRTPHIVSYCSTRPLAATKELLHSYHVVTRNLLFGNNHDGTMRGFFSLGMKEIDLRVYTRNAQLLLPNCRAYGCPVALTKLSLEPVCG